MDSCAGKMILSADQETVRHECKRKQNAVDEDNEVGLKDRSTGLLASVRISSSKVSMDVKIQSNKYFPFSKRCAKIRDAANLPKLSGYLAHGGLMYQLSKRDFMEEFELLPRCGQKLGLHSDTEKWTLEYRLQKMYRRQYEAFSSPRYLELFRSELGLDIKIACSGELNFWNGHVDTSHLALGSFARFFAYAYEIGHTRMLDLNPYEAYFLADCGTLQVTLSHCPLGVEDVRAIMETKVLNFKQRYPVFSELQRTTRYSVRPYTEQTPYEAGRFSKQHDLGTKSVQQEESYLLQNTFQWESGYQNGERSGDTGKQSGFAKSFLNNADDARQGLTLTLADGQNLPTSHKSDGTAFETASVNESVKHPHRSLLSTTTVTDPTMQSAYCPIPNGIDIAFFGREKSMFPVRPAFDVAVTDYRDESVSVSVVFSAMVNKKNSALPLLMERNDCGSLSGYSLALAQIPEVEYSGIGRKRTEGGPSVHQLTPQIPLTGTTFAADSSNHAKLPVVPTNMVNGSEPPTVNSNESVSDETFGKKSKQWVPRALKRKLSSSASIA